MDMASLHTVSTWGTVPSWLTAVFSGGIFGVGTNFVIRWRRTNIEEQASDRQGYGDLIERMQAAVDLLTARVTTAENKATEATEEASRARTMASGMKLRLGQYEFAMRLMLGEFEMLAPENAVLKQVRSLLAGLFPIEVETAVPSDMLRTIDRMGDDRMGEKP